MPDDVKPTTRRYDASGRREAAKLTRRSILDAAIDLFTTQGYGATTLQQIADEAGVAVQTIYSTLANKPTILAEALDVAIAGDDEPVSVNDRDWMNDVWTAPTSQDRIRAYANAVTQIMTRASAMFMVVTAAALNDPRVASLDEETRRRRRLGAARVVESIEELSPLASGLDTERAIDLVWLLNSPMTHDHLVRVAGWSSEAYSEWLAHTLISQLLGGAE